MNLVKAIIPGKTSSNRRSPANSQRIDQLQARSSRINRCGFLPSVVEGEELPVNKVPFIPKSRAPATETAVPPDLSVSRFLTVVLPQVSRELRRWDKQLDHCEDWLLRQQARLSLRHKRFHAQGGSFFTLYNPIHTRELISLIVAFQTISDYLDNLCDRGGIYDEAAFRCLHHAMADALSPHPHREREYYRFYPCRNDGGYLQALVAECRRQTATLPSYAAVQPELLKLLSLYCDLQVYKHLAPKLRHSRLKQWARERTAAIAPPIYFWEYAAACGSTLALFALFGAAAAPETRPEEVKRIVKGYFPWICGLHILLDYWIDQEEDRIGGDFNFAACYRSPELAAQRLHLFLQKSLEGISRMPNPQFHRIVVHGLLAVYLSDPKVKKQGLEKNAQSLIKKAGPQAGMFFRLCALLRRLAVL
ncbi:MAG: tetraprenyl-beta-curcumene synthase family protein [Firmicutes bacterium]|jgi:tetraprenyl-beta-curcumene synthase|nr:tetraprenyl-beta-curcumene synthase family protein [Bacillota bacterium]